VAGTVRGAGGQPLAGAPVRVTGQPWLALSGTDGSYRLIAPTGSVQLAATDVGTGNSDFVEATVTDPASRVAINFSTVPRGPRVLSVSPVGGAINVPPVTPIIVTFSKPVNPATLVSGGIRLLAGTNPVPVAGALTLNLRNTIATLLPNNPLEFGITHTLVLSSNITDLNGLALEGPRQFTFETSKNVVRTELIKQLGNTQGGLPFTMVFNRAGNVAARKMGQLLPAELEVWSVALGIGITAAVGLFFGLYPALQAARLDPIEALRRE